MNSATNILQKRTRLSPEARRKQILDVAKKVIASDGLQKFSLKKLVAMAGISEPLLFHYFSSGEDLLRQLLIREYDSYLDAIKNSLAKAITLEEVCRVFVARNYDHHDEDIVMDMLLAEPHIATAVEARQQEHHKQRRKLLVNAVADDLGIKRKKAAMLVRMASASSIAAAQFAHDNNLGREEAIATAMKFIQQGFQSHSAK
ncbi:MAG: TetR/AcrR family transcriptional regulator [Gammaproteobacteria bacterium]|nr:TetR/AcrR family transcriptional regulator [Gammaproteobacteria bacterium]MDD9894231.1 TetR/AcrR family transcriptional regulator [Gammaproteobacteria bacterium]MDD9957432.1 TetR/AcrR family transcriptional regulator [Gammaproteobacteria bacterium]